MLTRGAFDTDAGPSVRLLVIADTTADLPADLHGFLAGEHIDAVVTAGDLLPTELRKFSTDALPKTGGLREATAAAATWKNWALPTCT